MSTIINRSPNSSDRPVENMIDQIGRRIRDGSLSPDDVSSVVNRCKGLPLSEIEHKLRVTDPTQTNDVRSRSGYSKNRYYAIVPQEARQRRREQIDRIIQRFRGTVAPKPD